LLKNVLYFIASIIVFVLGTVIYGIILNASEPSLPEAMVSKGLRYLVNVSIQIDRKKYTLDLYSDTILVKTYKAVFGRNSSPNKTYTNDDATPVGNYEICSIDTANQYYKMLRLNYPNKKDAMEALQMKLISKNNYDDIVDKVETGNCPPILNKNLLIGIHGIGKLDFIFKNLPFVYNWTNGSIAVSNEDIDEIYSATRIGTEVVIKN
jgi:murein L,D-transpeptidase YafK